MDVPGALCLLRHTAAFGILFCSKVAVAVAVVVSRLAGDKAGPIGLAEFRWPVSMGEIT